MEKLPAIYEKRAKLLRLSLDMKMSAAELNKLVTPMEGKTEEEKEEIAKQLFQELSLVYRNTGKNQTTQPYCKCSFCQNIQNARKEHYAA